MQATQTPRTRILIALGGNAIKQANEAGSKEEQMRNVNVTSMHIARIIKADPDRQVVLTHGNGPQAGNLAVQQDLGKAQIPAQPFDIVGAMTQGQIGWMFQNQLQNHLIKEGINTPCVSIINQVLVDKSDPEFQGENASKPVGNFMTQEEAMHMKAEKGWIVKHVKPTNPKGWRRVVPSPDPLKNMEADTIAQLVDNGVIVIASGGGGIPVIQESDGTLSGVEAVIDKDLAGQKLAAAVHADTLMILTDVPAVCLNYGKPNQEVLGKVSLAQMEEYLRLGHFGAGSMLPKVKACVRHLRAGGKRSIIASLEHACEALEGKCGTQITP